MTTLPLAPPDHSLFEDVACYYCGATDCSDLVTGQDDLTGKPGDFRFVTCGQCGLAYQAPRIRVEHIGAYYDDEYISHRKKTNWGVLTWFYRRGMDKHDREKDKLVSRYARLDGGRRILDVGCGSGTFLQRMRNYEAEVTGVDFKNLTHLPYFEGVDFHEGLFYERDLPDDHYDVVTMWHFLEHDYDPQRTLRTAGRVLKPETGRLVIEVPRLDSLTFRLYRERWPGLQAPQHTVLYTKEMLLKTVERAGLEVVDYLPYGAFPPYFYLFTGAAFKVLRGKGLDLQRAIYPYFLGQLFLSPVLLFERRLNLAMQTVVCRALDDGGEASHPRRPR